MSPKAIKALLATPITLPSGAASDLHSVAIAFTNLQDLAREPVGSGLNAACAAYHRFVSGKELSTAERKLLRDCELIDAEGISTEPIMAEVARTCLKPVNAEGTEFTVQSPLAGQALKREFESVVAAVQGATASLLEQATWTPKGGHAAEATKEQATEQFIQSLVRATTPKGKNSGGEMEPKNGGRGPG